MNIVGIDRPDALGGRGAGGRDSWRHSMIDMNARAVDVVPAVGAEGVSEAMPVSRVFPGGLWRLCLVVFLEQASFYGIRAILILYMVAPIAQGGLALPDSTAAAGYGLYLGAVYLSALLGGWIGDRWLGARGALLAGAIAIVLGHLQLGLATSGASWLAAHGMARQTLLAASLATIVLGTGLFKPNITALVGQLYEVNDRRRDRGFTRFYMVVNAGALAGGLAVGWIAARFGWTPGFLAASLGVVLCVVVLSTARIPRAFEPSSAATGSPRRALGIGALAPVCGWAAVSIWALTRASLHELGVWSAAVIAVICIAYFYLARRTATAPERRGIEGVIVLFAVGVVFIFGFEQAGSWMTLFAARYVAPSMGGFRVPAAWYTALNAVFVVLMAPVVGAMWTYRKPAAADYHHPDSRRSCSEYGTRARRLGRYSAVCCWICCPSKHSPCHRDSARRRSCYWCQESFSGEPSDCTALSIADGNHF
jgi:POT family proton-dependent oligopeptide transporter